MYFFIFKIVLGGVSVLWGHVLVVRQSRVVHARVRGLHRKGSFHYFQVKFDERHERHVSQTTTRRSYNARCSYRYYGGFYFFRFLLPLALHRLGFVYAVYRGGGTFQ